MKRTLILGLGNLLQGDDGVGCRVAQELERIVTPALACGASVASREAAKQSPSTSEIAASQKTLRAMTDRDDIEVIDAGTPGIGLLNLFEGRKRVIIIDAAEMGLPPGEFRRFEPQDVMLTGSNQRFSLHRTGVIDALTLARELNITLPQIVFFGVQPAIVDWNDALSPAVQAAVPQVIEAVLNEVK